MITCLRQRCITLSRGKKTWESSWNLFRSHPHRVEHSWRSGQAADTLAMLVHGEKRAGVNSTRRGGEGRGAPERELENAKTPIQGSGKHTRLSVAGVYWKKRRS